DGHLTAATSSRAARTLEGDVAWLARAVNDRTPRFLTASEMATLTGSTIYRGGYLDPRSAGIHPLNYCREFAAALMKRGVPIYGSSPATAIHVPSGGGHVRVETSAGSVSADKVLICTNA